MITAQLIASHNSRAPRNSQEHKEEDAHFEPVLPGPDEAQEAFSVGSRSGLPLSSSAPPMVGSRHSLPPGRRAARARPYLASEVQDRQQPRPSAFQRTFSERVRNGVFLSCGGRVEGLVTRLDSGVSGDRFIG